MKKILFIAAACMFAAACTPQNGGGETASLEVSPKSLTFGAEDTTPQEITVTATGVEWEYAVPSSADWITVDDGTAGKLLVSVTKNPTAEKRTASIRITAKDNDDLEPVSVTVTQAGSETPEVYSLTVDPAALTFEAEGAAVVAYARIERHETVVQQVFRRGSVAHIAPYDAIHRTAVAYVQFAASLRVPPAATLYYLFQCQRRSVIR